MAATLTDPLLGHLVDGRYEVLSRIARGGMATVYLAVDRRLDRDVALKVMHPHLAEGTTGAEFVARFRREARAAARLTHPGLVAVLDQGVDGETSYLTMEYVEGTDLRRRLEAEGPLTVGDALRTAESVLEALAVAHRAGLVHRDVKPENVLLSAAGQVKVADFGLARAVTEATSTTTGTVLGTVAYLAPELVAHGRSDVRTDVYAVGIVLHEMLTGRQPFTGTTPIQVAYQHVHSDVPDVSAAVPWMPSEVDELVAALAARDPQERPADGGAALALVRRVRSELDADVLARRADRPPVVEDDDQAAVADDGTAATAHTEDPDATTSIDVAAPEDDVLRRTIALRVGTGLHAPGSAPAPRRRRRLLAVAALVALLAAAAAALWWYLAAGPGAYREVPAGLVAAEREVAEAVLAEAGLGADVTEDHHPDVAPGIVVSATPGEGEAVRKDGTVELLVSLGPDMRAVPEALVDTPVADATAALTAAGFTVLEPALQHHDTVAEGHVVAVPLEAGSEHPLGTEVQLTVSQGPAPVEVPDVVGEERQRAIVLLEEAFGPVVQVAEDYSEEHPAGVVAAQSVEAGSESRRMTPVTITVSLGPPPVAVPDVQGKDVQEARTMLEEAGLVVDARRLFPWDRVVVEQEPAGGTEIPKGSTVVLTIR